MNPNTTQTGTTQTGTTQTGTTQTGTTQTDEPTETDVSGRQNRGCPPPTPEESQRRWAAWHQAMEFSHEMLMMGLRQKIGPDGDLQAAYREWYERYQAIKWDTNRAP